MNHQTIGQYDRCCRRNAERRQRLIHVKFSILSLPFAMAIPPIFIFQSVSNEAVILHVIVAELLAALLLLIKWSS